MMCGIKGVQKIKTKVEASLSLWGRSTKAPENSEESKLKTGLQKFPGRKKTKKERSTPKLKTFHQNKPHVLKMPRNDHTCVTYESMEMILGKRSLTRSDGQSHSSKTDPKQQSTKSSRCLSTTPSRAKGSRKTTQLCVTFINGDPTLRRKG